MQQQKSKIWYEERQKTLNWIDLSWIKPLNVETELVFFAFPSIWASGQSVKNRKIEK